MDDDKSSSTLKASAQEIARSIHHMTETGQMAPPFKVHVTGPNDEFLMDAQIDEMGRVADAAGPSGHWPIDATYPIHVTITDIHGRTLDLTISSADLN